MMPPTGAVAIRQNELPVTIDHDWHRFYRDYPDIYDRFAITTPLVVSAMQDLVDVAGKVVVDAGSGTGKSTFALARRAQWVYGVEPSASMRAYAEQQQYECGIVNVTFLDGTAPDLPLPDQSADVLVSVYAFPWNFPSLGDEGQVLGERFLNEARRVLRPGSTVIACDNAPGWYGGEVVSRLQSGQDEGGRKRDAFMQQLGFASRDLEITAEYASVAEAVATYGFIYGHAVIADLIAHGTHVIPWRPRIYWQAIEPLRQR